MFCVYFFISFTVDVAHYNNIAFILLYSIRRYKTYYTTEYRSIVCKEQSIKIWLRFLSTALYHMYHMELQTNSVRIVESETILNEEWNNETKNQSRVSRVRVRLYTMYRIEIYRW